MISTGVVSSTSPLTVTLDGATSAVGAKAIYSPSVGDRVVVLQYGRLLLVLPTSPISGGSGSSGVSSFNTRTGAVTLTKVDVTGTGLAAADVGAATTSALSTEVTRATGQENLKLAKASNLSDLASAATALVNLGIPSPSGNAGKVLTVNSGGTGFELDTPSGGGGGSVGAVIGLTLYAPAAYSEYTVNATTSLAALDTTNLTVSFVAPASGNVLIEVSVTGTYYAPSDLLMCLVTHGTTTKVGAGMRSTLSGNYMIGTYFPLALATRITGLTPGATYHYDLAATSDAAGWLIVASDAVNTSSHGGPAMLKVTAL